MFQTSPGDYTIPCRHCQGLRQGESHLGLQEPKGLTSKARRELLLAHNSQVRVTNLGAQTRSQLHHYHLGWMGQGDSYTVDPKLPKVMLPSGPARTLAHMKHVSIYPTQGTGSKTQQYWFLRCSSCTFSILKPSKPQANSNILWLL